MNANNSNNTKNANNAISNNNLNTSTNKSSNASNSNNASPLSAPMIPINQTIQRVIAEEITPKRSRSGSDSPSKTIHKGTIPKRTPKNPVESLSQKLKPISRSTFMAYAEQYAAQSDQDDASREIDHDKSLQDNQQQNMTTEQESGIINDS